MFGQHVRLGPPGLTQPDAEEVAACLRGLLGGDVVRFLEWLDVSDRLNAFDRQTLAADVEVVAEIVCE